MISKKSLFCLLLAIFILPAYPQSKSKKSKKKSKTEQKNSKSNKKKQKVDEKKWKAKAKQYLKKPMSLKALVEGKRDAEEQLNSAKAKAQQLESAADKKDAKIAQLQDYAAELSGKLTGLETQVNNMTKNASAGKAVRKTDYDKGVVFKVQIGSFKQQDLSQYFKNNPNFAGEVTESGEQKVIIGIFRDYWEADKFKKKLREIGFRDSWIVPFKDGQRVDIKDVVSDISNDQAGT